MWHTDLDFLMVHKDRLVVLSFMTSPNSTTVSQPLSSTLSILSSEESASTDSRPQALPFSDDIVNGLRNIIGHDDHLNTETNTVGKSRFQKLTTNMKYKFYFRNRVGSFAKPGVHEFCTGSASVLGSLRRDFLGNK